MDQKTLQIKISNKDKLVFDGTGFAVSSKNEIGVFDILGEHSNFVSIIQEYVDVHRGDPRRGEFAKQRFVVDRGILTVKANIVEVFIGI